MKRPIGTLLLTLLAACPSPAGPDSDQEIRIRIINESAFTFERVIVKSPGLEEEFGPIPPESASAYRSVDHAFRYAYLEVHLANDTLVLQPVDYVGESPLPSGHYAYALDVDPQGPHLLFTFREP